MKWININHNNVEYTLQQAIYSNSNGLLMPQYIPTISKEFIDNIHNIDTHDICFKILNLYFGKEIPDADLKGMIKKTINFDCHLQNVNNNNILELFHGPTLSFKDYGARIMSEIFLYFYKENTRVIVATSGDTGAAVANAFSNTKIPVTIFFPNDQITEFQEKQICTNNTNISCIKLLDDFDSCQQMVKKMLSDDSIKETNFITANSINICRLIPQICYYFISYKYLQKNLKKDQKIVYTIPSGNLGNATACLMAKKMGLPIDNVIIACNSNDTIPNFFKTGEYISQKSIRTLSNAMDIGNPSNFDRIYYMYNQNIDNMRKDISTISVKDHTIEYIIKFVNDSYNYILDPHTAVGYHASNKLSTGDNNNVILATASPYKFTEIISRVLNKNIEIPNHINYILRKKSFSLYMKNNYEIIQKLFNKKVVILIGMPGSGKSCVSKFLNKKFKWKNIELDALIEKKYNMRLCEIIEQFGNKKLLEIEEEICCNIQLEEENCKYIISTGGSVVYNHKIMKYLTELGVIAYLQVSYIDLSKRINNFEERGIIFKQGETLYNLFEQRIPLYEKYSEMIIDNSLLTMNETVNVLGNLM